MEERSMLELATLPFLYTFCGLAAMILIGEANRLDLPRLLDWVVFRQGKECGFQGRTNKLVDGCYSFWQGGAVALLQRLHSIIDEQMAEASQFSTISDVHEEHESLAGTSSHATCCIKHEESFDPHSTSESFSQQSHEILLSFSSKASIRNLSSFNSVLFILQSRFNFLN
ncbi:unnamed protein product [Trifolium pratense]|uniref:Uncharacterized protein n=1 Tax=Trifolium pratense TaxID=57577 RepID=A0ACB0JXF1_TRIPR|nr:unnamed protein product [Trifolium pratense]